MPNDDARRASEIEDAYAERAAQAGAREWWERDDDPAVASYKAEYYRTHPASLQLWAAAESTAEEGRAR